MTKSLQIVLLAVALLAANVIVEAQQVKPHRVGMLPQPGDFEELHRVKGLRAGLASLGYVEGKTLQLDIPDLKTSDELRAIAKRFAGENAVDVIVSSGGTATNIGKEAIKDIPIVFMAVSADPVEMGFVKSLARPETNLTGLTTTTGPQFEGKRLELFKQLVPNLRRLTLLYNARGESPGHEMRLAVMRDVAPKLGINVSEKPAKSFGDVDQVFRAVSRQTTDGLYIIGSGLFREPCKKLAAIVLQKKLPLWGCGFEEGSLATYRADEFHHGYRAGWYVDKILKGIKPADLPVERPMKFEFVINLKAARQIGLTIPPNVLVRADRVIK